MLIQGNCVKELAGKYDSVIDDSLEAPAGQSLLIKEIYCRPSSNDTYLTLKVNRVTVGFWRVKSLSGGHLSHIRSGSIKNNVMEFLAAKGINVSIPVAEGQVFTVSRYAEAGNVVLVFDRFDAGDIRADMPNGSAASEYVFMQYMNIGTGRNTSGDALFDTALSPPEFPDFPCAKSVPANHRITMLGLVGCPWNDSGDVGTAVIYTTHIKLIREREVLFDENRNGIPFDCYWHIRQSYTYGAGFSLIGAGVAGGGSGHGGSGKPLIFDPPLVFEAGVELNVSAVVVAANSPTWTDDLADLAAILKVEKV